MNQELEMNPNRVIAFLGKPCSEFTKADIVRYIKENNIRMWLLLENSSFKDAYAGRYRSQYKPKSLIASLLAFQARYNCRIVMCDESVSGKLIHDILYYEGREILMGMVDE